MFLGVILMTLGNGRLANCSSLQRLIGGLRMTASATRAEVTSLASFATGGRGGSTSILSLAGAAKGGFRFSLRPGDSILIGLRTTGGSSLGGLLGV